jgi:hypothetical protein
MITLTAESKQYGNSSQYIARIVGRSTKFTYEREFTGRKSDRTTTAHVDEAGLFEIVDIDKKGRKEPGFVLVVDRPAECPPLSPEGDPDFIRLYPTEKDALAIAKRFDAGEKLSDFIAIVKTSETEYGFEIRTKAQAARASVAASIDAITEQCWTLLQMLPEKEAKKVLAALKSRVSPKPAEPTATSTQSTK